ncbi:hypothetical protein PYCCODRAFT_1365624 [Trametes coccinea BRFM310]|uniref:Uncharacterized protein n=1 Tax=Trametes coccinea (strain BRFM310) TaxID=1353009 RepID=A0A1Y2IQY8_TRAC3|nr:hypothetical protein PYCCODRAFT_1365624 [Trametes coccinea BRFM310]
MAQPSPLPMPNVLKPPLPPSPTLQTHNPLFYPRKEFIRDQRIVSSFSLLTLAGPGFVRLYNFPNSVVNGLRRLFELHKLIVACKENQTTHFFEFSLDQKPWVNVKSITSEKLIVSIFSVIFQYGYSFLSTVEYGREHDDRIAIAFSRPTPAPASSAIPIMPNGSTSTLPHTSPMMFAISFPTPRVLRVIDPPLALTPAILQAVRNAWPRGIADEKKLGDTYEFKLKGYKWFQENTFAIDSLQQILSLLSALDRHSFTLLTSLTIGKRARTRDFWIFTGPPGENGVPESPPASPTGSSVELKNGFHHHGGSVSGSARPSSEGQSSQGRSTSPFASSPLRQMTLSTGSKLKKPFPKAELPQAFKSETSLDDVGRLPSDVGSVDMTGVGTAHRRAASQPRTPDVFYATGPQNPPGNVYQQEFNPWNRSVGPSTPTAPPTAAHFPTTPMGRQHSRHHSMSSYDDPFLRASLGDSPYDIARPPAGSPGSTPTITIPTPTPTRARRASSPLASSVFSGLQPLQTSGNPSSQQAAGNGSEPSTRHSDGSTKVERAKNLSDIPRIPTPPLLGPGAFRDSAFSSSTGWRSTEVPVIWTGKDPEPGDEKRKTAASGVSDTADASPQPNAPSPPRVLHGPRERRQSGGPRAELQAASHSPSPSQSPPAASTPSPDPQPQPPFQRASSGPALPGAWAPTPQEEKRLDDVVPGASGMGTAPSLSTTTTATTTMFPPTIKEQPSQEGDEAGVERKGQVRVHSPEQHKAEGEGARRSEAAWVGNMMDRNERTPPGGTMPKPHTQAVLPQTRLPLAATNSNASRQRASSISEGWVLVNIDGRGKGGARSPGQGQGPARPAPHTRSSSDSRIPGATHTLAQTTAGAGKSTMSPAAKAIVMVDAIGVKEAEREKAAQGSRFRRLLGRGKDKSGTPTPERGSPAPGTSAAGNPTQINGTSPPRSKPSTPQQQQQPNGPAVRARR